MVDQLRDLYVFVHVFKGRNGDQLAKQYIEVLLSLTAGNRLQITMYWFCYGFSEQEQDAVSDNLINFNSSHIKAFVSFYSSVGSEVPTLRRAVLISRKIKTDSLVLYLHSKGASYKDQNFFINWSLYSIASLSAAICAIKEELHFFDHFDSVGSFGGLGVFERFGVMTPAFSGNFWLTSAKWFSSQSVSSKWFADSFHNRHYAESLIGLNSKPSRMLNLEDNINYFSSNSVDSESVFSEKYRQIQFLISNDHEKISETKKYIDSFYEANASSQKLYSEARFAWKIRKFFFGNKSLLRYYLNVSSLLDRFFPWYCTELYKSINGPTHYDVYRKLFVD